VAEIGKSRSQFLGSQRRRLGLADAFAEALAEGDGGGGAAVGTG
jgi:hypothetical protein